MTAAKATPAGLYLHVPFCSAICPYCDFSVVVGRKPQRKTFVDLLIQEVEMHGASRWQFDTIYFGGGTPSILEPEDLERLLHVIRRIFSFRADTQLFLEANPEDVNPDNLAAWLTLGVDFLSLGVQSFEQQDLLYLGRRHTPDQARRAVEMALDAGFNTVSIDLIYGMPYHKVEAWRETLETAVALGPHHISCYELEIHEKTSFFKKRAKGELRELDHGTQAELFLFTHRFLQDHHYPGYEVSNFSRRTKYRSRHNRKYWDHSWYLGLGPSAHSFDGRRRWWNERLVPQWEKKLEAGFRPEGEDEVLTGKQLALEALMLGLRTSDGVDLMRFTERYGINLLQRNAGLVESLENEGKLVRLGSRLVPTLEGFSIADRLAIMFEL